METIFYYFYIAELVAVDVNFETDVSRLFKLVLFFDVIVSEHEAAETEQ